LVEETGLRQNVLSHHLNVMLHCGLIRAHASLGDARRHYYSVDLTTAHCLGEWWDLHTPQTGRSLPALKRPRRVLFICLYTTTRSVMAELLARHLAPNALVPFSAGLRAAPGPPLLPMACRVLEEHGLAVGEVAAKTYHDVVSVTTLDYVIAVCDIVHEAMLPPVLAQAEYLHWSLRDPLEGETEQEQLAISRELCHELEQRITFFVRHLAHEEIQAEPS
jgi:protein-tyrosine-phosphatase